jgi:hypothetical protein
MACAVLFAKNKTTPETVEFGDFFPLYFGHISMYSPDLKAIIQRKYCFCICQVLLSDGPAWLKRRNEVTA